MSYYLIGDSGSVAFTPFSGVVQGEDATYTNKATSNPIEGGGTINDHAVAEPVKVSVSGAVTKDSGQKAALVAMAANCDLVSYRGHGSYNNMLITSLTIGHAKDAGQGGFTFKATLQEMRVTGSALAPVAQFSMSSGDRGATVASSKAKGTKAETNVGLVTPDTGYAQYVASFNNPTPSNTAITGARTQPSNRGY